MENVKLSKEWLEKAIRRHDRHMASKEPTTGTDGEISQQLLMEEMKYAMKALVEGKAVTTSWYASIISKFP